MEPETTPQPLWQTLSLSKQSRILANIPQEFIHPSLTHSTTSPIPIHSIPKTLLSPQELQITSLSPTSLITSIKSKTYTALQILNAFTHRAVIAHQLLNCCLEFTYEEAKKEAVELDRRFEETGELVGALHGIPVSVKDQVRVKGTETTCGFVANLGAKDADDCLLVEVLRREGALVFVKTSLSMGCMWGETVNNIIGRTSNPFNRSFSCGGSSGGEGALIGFHASPIGVGSDLGGSIRSPSAYQGLYGLRPSTGRLPYLNILNSMQGQETIPSVIGPMSHSPESLALFTKTIIDSKPWLHDPKCHPIPWRQPEFDVIANNNMSSGKKLKIGVMHWDGVILPQPPVRRAMKILEKKLLDAGHEVIPWRIDQKRALELVSKVFSSDANGDIDRTIANVNEPPLPLLSNSTKPPLTLLESWDLAHTINQFRAEVLTQWNSTSNVNSTDTSDSVPMDAFIAPVNPSVCPRHDDYLTARYIAYTATVNLMDFSACTIPVTTVDEEIDLADDKGGEIDGYGEAIPGVTCESDAVIRRNFGKGGYGGLPVGLQVVGRRLEEEKILGIATVLEGLLVGGKLK